ncbi:MAG: homoserine kinase [Magnetococcales bacterium]|nr:homoserine kinase [Magnetococcales bacterium]
MSVYTQVGLPELVTLLERYPLGTLVSLSGMTNGIDNSNYRLETSGGVYVLTLIENSAQVERLPQLLALLTHLSKNAIPCPLPIADNSGQLLQQLAGKPALLVNLLPGCSPTAPTAGECYQVGQLLANIHRVGQHFSPQPSNLNGLPQWRMLLDRLRPLLFEQQPELLRQIEQEIDRLSDGFFNQSMPAGLCHSDLFPDNSLFVDGKLTGVLDFHFACHEQLIYDVAIMINAWGFQADGSPNLDRLRALWQGYCALRPPVTEELVAFNDALRAAAMRFLLTRLRDRYFPRTGQQVLRKPPEEYLTRLQFHQQHRAFLQFEGL